MIINNVLLQDQSYLAMVKVKVPFTREQLNREKRLKSHSVERWTKELVAQELASSKRCRFALDVFYVVVSVGTFAWDVGSDGFLAYRYYVGGHWWWFGLTLAFVVVPSLTVMALSLVWYWQENADTAPDLSRAMRCLWFFLQLELIFRSVSKRCERKQKSGSFTSYVRTFLSKKTLAPISQFSALVPYC